jgi:hypothetical protein
MPGSFTFLQCNVQRAGDSSGEDRLKVLVATIKAKKPDFIVLQETGLDLTIAGYAEIGTAANPKRSGEASQLNIKAFQRIGTPFAVRNVQSETVDKQRRQALRFDVVIDNRTTVPVRVYHANASDSGGTNLINHAVRSADAEVHSLHIGDFNFNLMSLERRIAANEADPSLRERIAAARDQNTQEFLPTHRSGSALDFAVHGSRLNVYYTQPPIPSSFDRASRPGFARDAKKAQLKVANTVDHYILIGKAEISEKPLFSARAQPRREIMRFTGDPKNARQRCAFIAEQSGKVKLRRSIKDEAALTADSRRIKRNADSLARMRQESQRARQEALAKRRSALS